MVLALASDQRSSERLKIMYHIYKDDPWGNKVPIMSIAHKSVADAYLRKHKDIITRVVNIPSNVQSLIVM